MNICHYLIRCSSGCITTLLSVVFLAALLAVPEPGFGSEMPGVWNVKLGVDPAVGNGLHDDTRAIQMRIDSAYQSGGGIVFLPAGNYLVTKTINLHSKVILKGVGGSTFGGDGFDPGYQPGNFEDSLSCKISLAKGLHVDIIRTDTAFYQSGIEGLALVGNRSGPKDTGVNGCRGIFIPDVRGHCRSQAKFRNVIILNTKGTGFYDGKNQNEIDVNDVEVMNCGGNGFALKGEDNKITRCGAGGNARSGFQITSGGAGRYYDVDAWGNEVGFKIQDVMNLFFFGIEANDNRTYGVEIGPGNTSISYTPSVLEFYRGYFSDNSTAVSGACSDVYLYGLPGSDQWGPGHVLFNGCLFLGFTNQGHPSFPIHDASVNIQRNVVSECSFWANHYVHDGVLEYGNSGENAGYQFRDCMLDDSDGLGVYSTNAMKVVSISDGTFQMTPWDDYVNADASSGDVRITLPAINRVQVGSVFYVSREDNSLNSVVVDGWKGQLIDGRPSVLVGGHLTTLMIVRIGSQWRVSVMAGPSGG